MLELHRKAWFVHKKLRIALGEWNRKDTTVSDKFLVDAAILFQEIAREMNVADNAYFITYLKRAKGKVEVDKYLCLAAMMVEALGEAIIYHEMQDQKQVESKIWFAAEWVSAAGSLLTTSSKHPLLDW